MTDQVIKCYGSMRVYLFEYGLLWLYRLLYMPCLWIGLTYTRARRRGRPVCNEQSRQLWGYYDHVPQKTACGRIWIQAASVGEVKLALECIVRLRAARHTEFFLSTTTTTGYALACAHLGDKKDVWVGFFPYDCVTASARAWEVIRPDRMVLIESELWPEHLAQARKRGVPVWVVNARMSDRSYARWSYVKCIARWLYGYVDTVAASCKSGVTKYRRLGIDSVCRVELVGQLKACITLKHRLIGVERERMLASMGWPCAQTSPCVLLGLSLWPGEERALLIAAKQAHALGQAVCVVLVPRHAEKASVFIDAIQKSDMAWGQRSVNAVHAGNKQKGIYCYLADTTGEVDTFLQLADVVMVGKSLLHHVGGQSPLDAARFQLATLMGPRYSNFSDLVDEMKRFGAIRVVSTECEATAVMLEWLLSKQKRAAFEQGMRDWYLSQQDPYEELIRLMHT